MTRKYIKNDVSGRNQRKVWWFPNYVLFILIEELKRKLFKTWALTLENII